MRLLSVFEARAAALVHESAVTRQVIDAQHLAFIRQRLVSTGVAVALVPISLATECAPAVLAGLLLAGIFLPLVALAVLSRTGHLHLAQTIWMAGLAVLAMLPALAGAPGAGGALLWLLLLPFEATFAFGSRVALAVGIATLAAWFAIRTMSGLPVGTAADLLFGAAALVYAASRACAIHADLLALKSVNRRYAAAIDALTEMVGDLVLHVDRAGRVATCDGSDDHPFGVSRDDLLDRGFFERLHVVDRPAFLKAVSDAAHGTTTRVLTLRLRGADLKRARGVAEPVFRWVELRVRVDGSTGVARGVLVVLRDVTEGKLHAETMEAARTAAEEASLSKDHFLANVSHELRTPLNAIIGFSEMMCSPQMAPLSADKQREYSEIVLQSGHHLLAVVNSLLDMSKIQAGSFELQPEAFTVAPLVDLCCEMIKLKAEEGGVELMRVYPDGLDELVADKRACKQILLNLLSNAVKFTPRGGRVTVGVQPDGNHLRLRVVDTGIGIDGRDLGRLGDAFFQARTGVDRPFEGTGLGLSVVRGLVGLHGGTIAIESAPGQGTAVTIRLPLDCAGQRIGTASAAIETLPRRSRVDDIASSKNMKVRKVA